ncbi:MAG: SEC-C domain-containing protein [Clostridia bacterium]|nr:SEC-C domain-containing protein [Clostridia bacterium]
MLQYFLDNKALESANQICNELNKIKSKITNTDYSSSYEFYHNCSDLFAQIEETAHQKNDEKLANAQLVFRSYFLLFCDLSAYFNLLSQKEYRKSWDKLQDCLDKIKFVRKYINTNRFETDDLYSLLVNYESLYPFSVFFSSDYVISKSHCSICGKSMLSPDCTHIKGNIYWGEMAKECVDEIEFKSVSIVDHPDDKRCVVEKKDDKRSEEEKFLKLHQFISLKQPFLQQFTVSAREGYKKDETIKGVGRNDLCPCGSGKKFKKCCGRNIYKEHIYYTVKPLNTVKLIIL